MTSPRCTRVSKKVGSRADSEKSTVCGVVAAPRERQGP